MSRASSSAFSAPPPPPATAARPRSCHQGRGTRLEARRCARARRRQTRRAAHLCAYEGELLQGEVLPQRVAQGAGAGVGHALALAQPQAAERRVGPQPRRERRGAAVRDGGAPQAELCRPWCDEVMARSTRKERVGCSPCRVRFWASIAPSAAAPSSPMPALPSSISTVRPPASSVERKRASASAAGSVRPLLAIVAFRTLCELMIAQRSGITSGLSCEDRIQITHSRGQNRQTTIGI